MHKTRAFLWNADVVKSIWNDLGQLPCFVWHIYASIVLNYDINAEDNWCCLQDNESQTSNHSRRYDKAIWSLSNSSWPVRRILFLKNGQLMLELNAPGMTVVREVWAAVLSFKTSCDDVHVPAALVKPWWWWTAPNHSCFGWNMLFQQQA